MITYTLVRLNNKLKNYIFKVILFFVQQQKRKAHKVFGPDSRVQTSETWCKKIFFVYLGQDVKRYPNGVRLDNRKVFSFIRSMNQIL